VSPENLSDPIVGPVPFSIESYGQSETAQTSAKAQQDPAVLLRYLDQFTNITDLGTQEEEVRDQLLSNQTEIEKAQSPVSRIPEFKKLRGVGVFFPFWNLPFLSSLPPYFHFLGGTLSGVN
jgi:hypothetical protein